MKRRNWTAADYRFIRANAGRMSSADFARHFGVAQCTIFRHCRRLGVSLRKTGDDCPDTVYSDATIERARAMHDASMRPRVIAAETGIPYKSLKKYLYYRARTGVPIHRFLG